jgi:hypothetical protein
MYKESIVEQLSSRTDGIASGNTIKWIVWLGV